MLKKIILALAIAVTSTIGAVAQSKADLFPIPSAPSDLTSLQERTDYVISHFWEHCNVKSILSSQQKFINAFDTYVKLMPYGSRRVVIRSIYDLLSQLEKNPKELLFVAEQAEAYLYSDSAVVQSDEAYIPFARAVATNKKINRNDKDRFERQVRLLQDCNVGMPAPELAFTDSKGSRTNIAAAADTASYSILFFTEADCTDCIMARGRLAANHTINDLIGKGLIKVIALTTDAPSSDWESQVSRFPEEWVVGSATDAEDIYDIRQKPTFYIIDRGQKIVSKNTPIDDIINLFNNMM